MHIDDKLAQQPLKYAQIHTHHNTVLAYNIEQNKVVAVPEESLHNGSTVPVYLSRSVKRYQYPKAFFFIRHQGKVYYLYANRYGHLVVYDYAKAQLLDVIEKGKIFILALQDKNLTVKPSGDVLLNSPNQDKWEFLQENFVHELL